MPEQRSHLRYAGLAFAVLAIANGIPAPATAQSAAPHAQAGGPHSGGLSLAFPTGDKETSTLLVEATSPAEARVGQRYEYQVQVTNLTKNLNLENVEVVQDTPEHFSIESSEPKPEGGRDSERRWSIDRLRPGESRMIKVQAIGDKEGTVDSCIRVKYQPTLCVSTRFVRAEIQVAKEAPERVNICDPITLRYTVKNTGSAALRGVKLRDELPDGLALTDGRTVVSSDVGDLDAGASKVVTAHAVAKRPGQFSSRAIAEGPNDLKAQSRNTTTAVSESELGIEIQGPQTGVAKEKLDYDVRVFNRGDAPAEQAQVQIKVDPKVHVVTVRRSTKDKNAPRIEGNTLTWDLETLQPHDSKLVSFTVLPLRSGEIRHDAVATTACSRGREAVASAKAEATARAEIQAIPALLLEMYDLEDPIQVGRTEQYRIQVINQGEGEDHNVQVVCSLPEQLEFVDSQGATKARAEGQTIRFEPIKDMAPKEKAEWMLDVKAVKPGDVRTRATLTSDYLTKEATETEPTRLLK
jgi:uncharacterized repeat protein (TIGR01451 family)